ncbi:penicillin amidase [Thermogymnomonas acidicola]|uniref:Penicillin amidase n=1 Tax=Thermogymnomonas acidicola TaxID=399579 RepID=A0AA37BS64_9ARCH|nr:penicillin amidase [Thermogymnomonas acidicola]
MIIIVVVVVASFTPLFTILNPNSGVEQNSRNLVIKNETYFVQGLQRPVAVIEDRYGVYHIYAEDNNDMFLTLGFLQAKERLFQMELIALASMGRLQYLLGSGYANYDRFQTLVGVPVTAQKDWQEMLGNATVNATDAESVQALEAYSEGINDYINYSLAHNLLPLEFKLLGKKPLYWNPVFSIAIQEYMIQVLEFSDDPLLYSLMYSRMGPAINSIIPPFNPIQTYYYAGYSGEPNSTVLAISENNYMVNNTVQSLALRLAEEWDPLNLLGTNPPEHSNEWVVAGNRTSTGHPILVGGPVLSFTLPSIWFQVQLTDPYYKVYGVVLPGEPAVIIGHNENIAWTLTDTEAISWGTFFFVQTVRDGQYLWNGTMHPLTHYHVNGMTVNWTNLGPVMVQDGSTALVMDWMGNRFSNDLGALLGVMRASNYTQFRDALSIWEAPYQNFAFADSSTIADISPGYYPVFADSSGLPYNPNGIMPGNGTEYIVSSIPYSMVPQAVDPASGFIVSSNQRQVGPAYPYWFGDTMSFSPGFRAQLEVDYLEDHTELTLRDMMTLQSENFTDTQAELLLPHIEANLSSSMNASVEDALSILSGWNYSMEPSSKAASVWFFSYMYIFNDTFSHIFEDYGIYPAYRSVLNVSGMGGSFLNTIGIPSLGLALTEMLITGHGLPGLGMNVTQVEVQGVEQAMHYLYSMYPDGNFTWSHFYGFQFPSILGIKSISVGPVTVGGDYNTPNDAPGVGPYNFPASGQSFKMVVNLANISDSFGIYPGGQSGNPASTQYANYINDWANGTYLPLLYYPSYDVFPSRDIMAEISIL